MPPVLVPPVPMLLLLMPPALVTPRGLVPPFRRTCREAGRDESCEASADGEKGRAACCVKDEMFGQGAFVAGSANGDEGRVAGGGVWRGVWSGA
jgi:hypothetical protein